jgi:protoporphyrinogen/coproporphyrinogen III oxidase
VTDRRRVVVVGGGIAGLAAAHRLVEHAHAGESVDVVLLEASERLGGSLGTERSDGFLIETGADSFITEKPWALALCERIGVPVTGTREGERRTYVVRGGRVEPLPEGFLLLAPTDPLTMARSTLFSWPGKLRMALDLVLPRRADTTDESVANFVRRRLGREALERAAQPLLGGIYTADAGRLSLAATMPRFREIERRHRSLILGLRAEARGRASAGSGARYALFGAPADGMGALVESLARRLPEGVVRLRTSVAGLARDGQGWTLRAGGEPMRADGVVLATQAYAAAALLDPVDATLAAALRAIEYASSATVTLAYRSADAASLRGFGFVVPAIERSRLLACTFASRKFAGRAPAGHELVRAFVGGALRPDILEQDDAGLVAVVRADLAALLGITASPLLIRVQRYQRAMPQYAVGHLDQVEAIEARAAAQPALWLAGAAYRGVGIPDCVRSGEAVADAIVAARGNGGLPPARPAR